MGDSNSDERIATAAIEVKEKNASEIEAELNEDIESLSNYDFDTYSNEEKYINIQLADLQIQELKRLRYLAVEDFKADGGEDIRECEECNNFDQEIKRLTDFKRNVIMSVKF